MLQEPIAQAFVGSNPTLCTMQDQGEAIGRCDMLRNETILLPIPLSRVEWQTVYLGRNLSQFFPIGCA
jgi:hypothetical protein